MSEPHQIAADVIRVLKKEDRYDWLPEIVGELKKELYRNADITVISAVPVPPADRKELERRLEARWGEHRVLYAVDPGVLSGMLIKFQDTVIDLTGQAGLTAIRQSLS